MTALWFSILLFAANLIVYKEAAMLLPFTGGLCIVLALWQLHVLRQRRAALRSYRTRVFENSGRKTRQSGAASFKDMCALREQTGKSGGQLRQQKTGKSGKRPAAKLHDVGNKTGVEVKREGNVIHASFPSTKEGRRRALEAFSKEKSAATRGDDQPLQ